MVGQKINLAPLVRRKLQPFDHYYRICRYCCSTQENSHIFSLRISGILQVRICSSRMISSRKKSFRGLTKTPFLLCLHMQLFLNSHTLLRSEPLESSRKCLILVFFVWNETNSRRITKKKKQELNIIQFFQVFCSQSHTGDPH